MIAIPYHLEEIMTLKAITRWHHVLVAALPVLLAACEGEASSEPLRRIEALEARVERLEQAIAADPQSARPMPLGEAVAPPRY